MSSEGEIALLIGLLCLAAFFSASEVGFLAVGATRVRQLREEGNTSARFLSYLLRRRSAVLSTVLIVVTACNYTAERLAVSYSLHIHPTLGPVVAAILMTVVVLVLCEVVPIQYAARNPERVALRSAAVVTAASIALSPLVLVFSSLSRLLLRLVGVHARTVLPTVTEEHLRAMIEQGEEQGAIEPVERRMLRGVLEFGDYTVAQIMTPRPDMVCVAEDEPLQRALELGLEHRHSRLPVYQGTPDNITGVLHLKDLLPYALAGDLDHPVSTVARPAYHVPESLRADDLLHQLQHERQMLAIVKDEYGGTAGIVTVEDLLEEIVGDIRDEYDEEEPEVVQLADNEYLCDARVSLHELEDFLAYTQLPTEDYESLGGLVLDIAGHIPQVGEQVSFGSLTLTVERMNGNRIGQVRVVEGPPGDGQDPPRGGES